MFRLVRCRAAAMPIVARSVVTLLRGVRRAAAASPSPSSEATGGFRVASALSGAPLSTETAALVEGVAAGSRRALSRAITLVESNRREDEVQACHLMAELERRKMAAARGSFRIAISGPPGAGKSTFIERFGMDYLARGHRIAILAVDPSSPISGGSILGDKTRMLQLSTQNGAFVRPSPSRGVLGGVAPRTLDVIFLCEAAGFDLIVVETVGVGQSEYEVAQMVDMLLLLLPPAGGDDLQGIKKGIMEMADLVVVNKADGALLPAARRARAQVLGALSLVRPRLPVWRPKALLCSAQSGDRLEEVYEALEKFRRTITESGDIVARRGEQRKYWMWKLVKAEIASTLDRNAELGAVIAALEDEAATGARPVRDAADQLLAAYYAYIFRRLRDLGHEAARAGALS